MAVTSALGEPPTERSSERASGHVNFLSRRNEILSLLHDVCPCPVLLHLSDPLPAGSLSLSLSLSLPLSLPLSPDLLMQSILMEDSGSKPVARSVG